MTRYLYDGKRVIQERDGNNTPTVTYTRGKDLSGSLEGAGGIGGLLARSHGYSGGAWSTHNFYHADGNGNVTYMINSSQAMVATYKYDPYGRTISSSGTLAAANVYRFSSKELHVNSGLFYYLYRFYDPNTQRWLNRDPGNELGFAVVTHGRAKPADQPNNYRFAGNAPSLHTDPVGLAVWLCTRRTGSWPLGGYGRHAYLWDDRSPVQNHSCGMGSSYGSNTYGTAEDNDDGPIGLVSSPYVDPFTGVECQVLSGTEGNENELMDYCRQHVNDEPWWPGVFDCHTAAGRILSQKGFSVPSWPSRLNPGDPAWPLSLSWYLFLKVISFPGF
ncbi:MAG TPA: RHS repeat-associated core domain-containing protein [Verrucomicrobiae bacterium]